MLTRDRDVAGLPPLTGALPGLLLGQRSSYNFPPRAGTNPLEWAPSRQQAGASTSAPVPSRLTPVASGNAPSSRNSTGWLRGRPLSIAAKAIGGSSIGIGAGGVFCGPAHAEWLRLWPFPSWRKAAAASPGQKRVLIMMSETGGGHKASAEALRQAFQELYGDKFDIIVVDMWKLHTPAPFNQLPDSYSFLVKHSFLWRFAYETLQPRALHLPYFAAVHSLIGRQLSDAVVTYDPDLVVSVHPLMQHIPVRILRALAARNGTPQVPFATVVTDFTTCHNTWFYRHATKCFVPTDFARGLALRMGLRPEQVVVHGLPIRPVFSKKLPPQPALRRRLGLARDLPAILLVGGGEGMGKLEATVDELDGRLGSSAQVVVICGRNRKLLARLQAKRPPNGLKVVPQGFVDNIHEWMAACDCIITKAGPGTIAEALISGLPILLNGNVPCQEEGNIPYVVDNGAGAFETDPAKIAGILAAWLGPQRAEFDQMAVRSKALGRPEAVYRIVADLADMALNNPHAATQPVAAPARSAARPQPAAA